jgi:hypothetical protein
VDREYTFDSDSSSYSSNCEVGGGAFPVRQADNHTLEGLDTFPFPFPNAEVDPYCVAWAEGRDVGIGFGF